jgi:uncharacterized membrane protein YjdF
VEHGNRFRTIAWAATAVFLLFSVVGNGPSTYRYAFVFLGPLLWTVYFLRHTLKISCAHFAFLAFAFVVHNLGAFGAYRMNFAGLDFDTYVHFIFGMAGGFIVARALGLNLNFGTRQVWVGTILLILGLGAVHELVEFVSTLWLGPEKGMLKIDSPDKFDTHKDLANNLFGTLAALALSGGLWKWRKPASTADGRGLGGV